MRQSRASQEHDWSCADRHGPAPVTGSTGAMTATTLQSSDYVNASHTKNEFYDCERCCSVRSLYMYNVDKARARARGARARRVEHAGSIENRPRAEPRAAQASAPYELQIEACRRQARRPPAVREASLGKLARAALLAVGRAVGRLGFRTRSR
eukprot:COSAG02_NODE_394_length_23152_cov_13.232204_10_plen_153_part_00